MCYLKTRFGIDKHKTIVKVGKPSTRDGIKEQRNGIVLLNGLILMKHGYLKISLVKPKDILAFYIWHALALEQGKWVQ